MSSSTWLCVVTYYSFSLLYNEIDFLKILFIYFWLCWVFIAVRAFPSYGEQGLLSSCGPRASHHCGFSGCKAQALGHSGFSSCGSQACGIFLDQGSNQCLLYWQAAEPPGKPLKLSFSQGCSGWES